MVMQAQKFKEMQKYFDWPIFPPNPRNGTTDGRIGIGRKILAGE
jgi:hypothetical protein